MKRILLAAGLAVFAAIFTAFAQKKSIEMEDIHRWKSIDKQIITPDGQWVAYVVKPVSEGDTDLRLWNAGNGQTISFARAEQPVFSDDGQWLVCTIKPALDSIRALKRKKVKADDLPKDTLLLYSLQSGVSTRFPRVKGFFMPEYWSGWLAVHIEPAAKAKEKEKVVPKDSTTTTPLDSVPKKVEKPAKTKKESAENGSLLILRNLTTGVNDTVPYVISFAFAKQNPAMLFHTSGTTDAPPEWKKRSEIAQQGVYFRNLDKKNQRALWRGKAKYKQLSLDESGEQAVFLVDSDTSKAVIRPWQLGYARTQEKDTAQVIADNSSSWLPAQPASSTVGGKWLISDSSTPSFSKEGDKLFFGIVPPPVQPDTTRLPEEAAKVEVWATSSPFLYTFLEERMKTDIKKTWPVVCFTDKKMKFTPLTDPENQESRIVFDRYRKSDQAILLNNEPYMQASQWLGEAGEDVYSVDLRSGNKKLIIKGNMGSAGISPLGNYALLWSSTDTAWYVQSLKGASLFRLTSNNLSSFYNTDDDIPDAPSPYGIAGWMKEEKAVLVYDKFDIWRIPLLTRDAPVRLTNGRASNTTYRYIKTEQDALTIDATTLGLLHAFNHETKKESYVIMDFSSGATKPWMEGEYRYTRAPLKAKRSNAFVYTRQNFDEFPNLRYAQLPQNGAMRQTSNNDGRISDVNPQQSEYAWPKISMVKWISPTGDTLSGLLVKPADYNPAKKYPMIVNFYEKLSDELYQHRSPAFARSQISATQYASRGYLVFMPDIPYRIGYPGESAYNAIVSGVTNLIQQGGVDAKRIALQGHSWGGYEAAYLITKTNLFRCAEAGAAVVNMTSAYGGIRWESGVSRHFQYEHQQSRIGGSLWEKPMLYLENSPLFALNKVQTPVLILHNDKDGAVPWEQGIEFFTGLRRLGKPAWLLNYNDEPHWPVKLPNRIDFQKRMQQFFDYYLLDAPQPRWMEKGIPPMEKEAIER
jgi:dipeptidyl aminopeptidase/acylaminoacyl peptidase